LAYPSDSYQPPSAGDDLYSADDESSGEYDDSPVSTLTETMCASKHKKRLCNVNNRGKMKAKRFTKSGQAYKSRTGKLVEARKMCPLCSDKCILSCTKKISQVHRFQLFVDYWAMGSLQQQRDYLNSCIESLIFKYRHVSAQEPRKPNCAFYITKNEQKIRVYKTFMINTLEITERKIGTVV